MTNTPPSNNRKPDASGAAPSARTASTDPAAQGDRRTLMVGALSMIALVFAGVVASMVFTTSLCDALEPELLAATPTTGTNANAVLAEVSQDRTGGPTESDLRVGLAAFVEVLGPVTSVTDVTGATNLTVGSHGPVAAGPITTRLGAGTPAAAQFGTEHVVGDGTALYTLSIGNELTGQVDASRALNVQFEAGACIEAATMGSPLAFFLDANDGELLLLRIDDDASDGYLELRDAVIGRQWMGVVEYETSQPGVVGERMTGVAGPSTIVVGTSTSPGSDVPPLQALDRNDGETLWALERDDLAVLRSDMPERVEVLGANDEVVVVHVRAARPNADAPASRPTSSNGDAAAEGTTDGADDLAAGAADDAEGVGTAGSGDDATLLAVAIDDGTVLWDAPIVAGQPFQQVSRDGTLVWLLLDNDEVVGFDLVSEGAEPGSGRAGVAYGGQGRVATIDDGVLAVTRGSLVVDRPGERETVGAPFEVHDVVVDQAKDVTVLLGLPNDDASIAVTFAGP